ncbi:MAG: peptide deformylase [Bacteroidetes bacterium]|nr:peptide deformylase [Bacteroidota bacterium]
MILPVYAIGFPVLRQKAKEITPDYPELNQLIADMYETMYASNGIGLAAPQIGLGIRLFITDGSEIDDIQPEGFKQVFINPEILEEFDTRWDYEEGCLSIPTVRADVNRHSKLVIRYFDEHFKEHVEEYDGMAARIIQHEYDHLEGILFTDRITPLKRTMLKTKLNNIAAGRVNVQYKMKFAKR